MITSCETHWGEPQTVAGLAQAQWRLVPDESDCVRL